SARNAFFSRFAFQLNLSVIYRSLLIEKFTQRHPERRSLEGSSQEMPWMLPLKQVQGQHDVTIKIKAKAKCFCQTIEKIKDRNENQMPGESRLVPLRDSCNGGTHVGLDGFRYSHRNQNIV
ncbi:MAG: hypothetical protein II565_11760, partial [Fibrobacter sp.]|nr:hypothetical protein [Fibrobacter sp.]